MHNKRDPRPWAVGFISIITALAMLALGAAVAGASVGGAPTPSASPPPPSSEAGTPSSEPSAGTLSLLAGETKPKRSFYFGYRAPSLRFTIGSTQPLNDIRVDIVNPTTQEIVKTFYRDDVPPEVAQTIRWDGSNNEGRPAHNGHYMFRISPQASTPAPAARRATPTTTLSLGFELFSYAFPVLGAHEFNLSAGRFGAARAGHTHEGQDVMAACGLPLVAARGGKVQFTGYQAAAGNYIVIDGRGTPYDFMYAHLAEPTPLHTGETVRTGQPIGIVGETGDATACHLHFEMWSAPGWYEGGSPFDPLPYLEEWDQYS